MTPHLPSPPSLPAQMYWWSCKLLFEKAALLKSHQGDVVREEACSVCQRVGKKIVNSCTGKRWKEGREGKKTSEMKLQAGSGWDGVNLFPIACFAAVFGICDQNSVDNTPSDSTLSELSLLLTLPQEGAGWWARSERIQLGLLGISQGIPYTSYHKAQRNNSGNTLSKAAIAQGLTRHYSADGRW